MGRVSSFTRHPIHHHRLSARSNPIDSRSILPLIVQSSIDGEIRLTMLFLLTYTPCRRPRVLLLALKRGVFLHMVAQSSAHSHGFEILRGQLYTLCDRSTNVRLNSRSSHHGWPQLSIGVTRKPHQHLWDQASPRRVAHAHILVLYHLTKYEQECIEG
jgi:hypothetical protein